VRRERRVKIFFALKNGWWFARAWSAWQATINRRAAACGKGVGYTFRRAKPSPYKIEGEGGRFGSTKRKNIIVRCGLHDVVQPGGRNKKIVQR
jgi:hypothetical protein